MASNINQPEPKADVERIAAETGYDPYEITGTDFHLKITTPTANTKTTSDSNN